MRDFTGKLLELGIALYVLAAPAAFAGANPDQPVPLGPLAPQQVVPTQVPQPAAAAAEPNPTVNQEQQAPLPPIAQPATPAVPTEAPRPFHGSVSFESGSGKILTLALPAANIYVADPKVAEVRPASSTSLFVFGVGAGHTTIAAVDTLGRLLADYDVTVRPSAFGAREAQAAISRLVPGSRVVVKPSGKGMMLTGGVASASDAAQAVMIAKGFSGGDGAPVENQMTIAAPTQVTLMVRIAEMKRSTARNIGIDWAAQGFFGKIAPLAAGGAGAPLLRSTFNGLTCNVGTACIDSVLNALAKDGLAHILAEPNLTVMSGQAASFQAGGEYPYVVAQPGNGSFTYTVDFKPYGVLLNFMPTVLSSGRINLHVKPEVSQLDATNTVQIPNGGAIDGLLVRRAETTVELGSGEAFAIAGMLQTVSTDNNSGIPALSETPVIGSLFKTNSMSREQTELVIIVTPLLVRPVQNVAQLKIPGEDYTVPGDINRVLLNRQVSNPNGTTTRTPGEAGFIVR